MYAMSVSARPVMASRRRGDAASAITRTIASAFAATSVGPAPKRSNPARRSGFISPCCSQPMYVAKPSKSWSPRLAATRMARRVPRRTHPERATPVPRADAKPLRFSRSVVLQRCAIAGRRAPLHKK